MTNKDFELLAAVLSDEHAAATTLAEQQTVIRVAHRLASNLDATHPRFDVARFMGKCLGY